MRVCPRLKSPLIEVRISKFGPKMHLSTVTVPIDVGIDWPWSSVSSLISNLFFSTKLCVSYSFCVGLCIFSETIANECSTFHMAPHINGFLYARGQGGAMDVKQSSNKSSWDHRSPASPRLGDLQWILQAGVGFRQIIRTSYTDILYYNIGNHRNNCKTSYICLYFFGSHTPRSALFLSRLSTPTSSSLFHILTSFVGTSPLMLTNRPCHGLQRSLGDSAL